MAMMECMGVGGKSSKIAGGKKKYNWEKQDKKKGAVKHVTKLKVRISIPGKVHIRKWFYKKLDLRGKGGSERRQKVNKAQQ